MNSCEVNVPNEESSISQVLSRQILSILIRVCFSIFYINKKGNTRFFSLGKATDSEERKILNSNHTILKN